MDDKQLIEEFESYKEHVLESIHNLKASQISLHNIVLNGQEVIVTIPLTFNELNLMLQIIAKTNKHIYVYLCKYIYDSSNDRKVIYKIKLKYLLKEDKTLLRKIIGDSITRTLDFASILSMVNKVQELIWTYFPSTFYSELYGILDLVISDNKMSLIHSEFKSLFSHSQIINLLLGNINYVKKSTVFDNIDEDDELYAKFDEYIDLLFNNILSQITSKFKNLFGLKVNSINEREKIFFEADAQWVHEQEILEMSEEEYDQYCEDNY